MNSEAGEATAYHFTASPISRNGQFPAASAALGADDFDGRLSGRLICGNGDIVRPVRNAEALIHTAIIA